ncbi:MAG: hypothetical protein PHS88_12505, partial [Candidatus Omnitrophica bacterium]|nr:hypothetical protein [Candidatus Omnitrophota bacterium]
VEDRIASRKKWRTETLSAEQNARLSEVAAKRWDPDRAIVTWGYLQDLDPFLGEMDRWAEVFGPEGEAKRWFIDGGEQLIAHIVPGSRARKAGNMVQSLTQRGMTVIDEQGQLHRPEETAKAVPVTVVLHERIAPARLAELQAIHKGALHYDEEHHCWVDFPAIVTGTASFWESISSLSLALHDGYDTLPDGIRYILKSLMMRWLALKDQGLAEPRSEEQLTQAAELLSAEFIAGSGRHQSYAELDRWTQLAREFSEAMFLFDGIDDVLIMLAEMSQKPLPDKTPLGQTQLPVYRPFEKSKADQAQAQTLIEAIKDIDISDPAEAVAQLGRLISRAYEELPLRSMPAFWQAAADKMSDIVFSIDIAKISQAKENVKMIKTLRELKRLHELILGQGFHTWTIEPRLSQKISALVFAPVNMTYPEESEQRSETRHTEGEQVRHNEGGQARHAEVEPASLAASGQVPVAKHEAERPIKAPYEESTINEHLRRLSILLYDEILGDPFNAELYRDIERVMLQDQNVIQDQNEPHRRRVYDLFDFVTIVIKDKSVIRPVQSAVAIRDRFVRRSAEYSGKYGGQQGTYDEDVIRGMNILITRLAASPVAEGESVAAVREELSEIPTALNQYYRLLRRFPEDVATDNADMFYAITNEWDLGEIIEPVRQMVEQRHQAGLPATALSISIDQSLGFLSLCDEVYAFDNAERVVALAIPAYVLFILSAGNRAEFLALLANRKIPPQKSDELIDAPVASIVASLTDEGVFLTSRQIAENAAARLLEADRSVGVLQNLRSDDVTRYIKTIVDRFYGSAPAMLQEELNRFAALTWLRDEESFQRVKERLTQGGLRPVIGRIDGSAVVSVLEDIKESLSETDTAKRRNPLNVIYVSNVFHKSGEPMNLKMRQALEKFKGILRRGLESGAITPDAMIIWHEYGGAALADKRRGVRIDTVRHFAETAERSETRKERRVLGTPTYRDSPAETPERIRERQQALDRLWEAIMERPSLEDLPQNRERIKTLMREMEKFGYQYVPWWIDPETEYGEEGL